MMCAYTAACGGAQVVLLEPNRQLGRKVRITGKGRCNVTNDCDTKTFLQNIPGDGRFLYSALSRFSPQDTQALFESLGVPLKVERGNRVFPVSDRAHDIADALLGDSVNDVTPTFTMPAAGDNVRDGEKLKYPGHYALAFTAVYENRITALNASLTAPEANEKLASEAKIRFDKEIPAQSQLISWTYSYKENGKTVIVPASGTAYRDTVYTATITIPKNPKEGILFAPSGSLTGTATAGTVKSVTRNDADGSARIVIEFAKTAPDKGPVRPDEKKAAEQEKYNKQVAAAKKIKAKLTSANAGKYRQAVVKWKKVKSVNGYQIRYSTNKNFKKGVKSVKVNKAGTVKKTLTKLTVGNTYR